MASEASLKGGVIYAPEKNSEERTQEEPQAKRTNTFGKEENKRSNEAIKEGSPRQRLPESN